MYDTVAAAERDLRRAFLIQPCMQLSTSCMSPSWPGGILWQNKFRAAVQAAFQDRLIFQLNVQSAFDYTQLPQSITLPDVSHDKGVQLVLRRAWPYYLRHLDGTRKHRACNALCYQLGMTRMTVGLIKARLTTRYKQAEAERAHLGHFAILPPELRGIVALHLSKVRKTSSSVCPPGYLHAGAW